MDAPLIAVAVPIEVAFDAKSVHAASCCTIAVSAAFGALAIKAMRVIGRARVALIL